MKRSIIYLFTAVLAIASTACNKEEMATTNGRQEITIGIKTATIGYAPLPTGLRAAEAEASDLMAIQVYEVVGEDLIPHAQGLFSDWSALSFKGYDNTTYLVEATMIVDATDEIEKDANNLYGKPFEATVGSEMTYAPIALSGISSSIAELAADGNEYTTPNIDRYYGEAQKMVTAADATISTRMKRMSFGVKTENIDHEITLAIAGAPEETLGSDEMELYSLNDLKAAYSADEATAPYSETMQVAIKNNGNVIFDEEVAFLRNKLATISVDEVTGKIGFEFETPFEDEVTLRILTFEDADYVGSSNMLGNKDWSSLIDDPEYGAGGLLYGESMFMESIKLGKYEWYDEGNTELAHRFLGGSFGTLDYAGGGHAISNYVETDLALGDYTRQLSVVVKDPVTGNGGCDGSRNFAMHYGYIDNSGFGMTSNLPQIYFHDGVARVIDHMYIAPNTYLANCVTNGNGLTDPLGNEGYVNIIAIAYNGETKVGELKFELANENGFIDKWTKWDLSSLGKVTKIEFNMEGDSDNGYGFSQPAYFAYDNVAVQF